LAHWPRPFFTNHPLPDDINGNTLEYGHSAEIVRIILWVNLRRNYPMPDLHWKFEEAIRANHGCDSCWLRSVTVTVELRDHLRWRGAVEVFALYNHPKASIAYAWTYRGGGREKIVTVLGIHPIDSAQAAVKSVIGNNAQGN
jgi:hypothetical protein